MHCATISWYIPISLFNGEGENGDSTTSKLVHFIVIKQVD